MVFLLRLALLAGVSVTSRQATGQIISQLPDTVAGQTIKYSGSAGFDFRLQGGNIRQQLYRFSASAQLENGTIFLNPNCIYSQNRIFDNVLESDIFSYVLAKMWPGRRFYPAASLMYENSVIRSIDFRYLTGAGIGLKVMNRSRAILEVIELTVYDRTEFKVQESVGYKGLRSHTALVGSYEILKERLLLEHRIFYSVLLSGASNHRLRTLATLKITLTKHLSITGNIDFILENVVDINCKKHNYSSTGGVLYTF